MINIDSKKKKNKYIEFVIESIEVVEFGDGDGVCGVFPVTLLVRGLCIRLVFFVG